jgi:hypothetical protein
MEIEKSMKYKKIRDSLKVGSKHHNWPPEEELVLEEYESYF